MPKRNFELKPLCLLVIMASLLPLNVFAQGLDFRALLPIPIQEGGRIKPLDTFARESVRSVTGKESYEKRHSVDILLDWLTHPDPWMAKNFILVENLEVRSSLGIPKDQKSIAPDLLLKHEGFMSFVKTCYSKQQKKMTLNAVEKETLAVYGRLHRFQEILSGDALTIVPVSDPKTQKWASVGDLKSAYDRDGMKTPEAVRRILFAFAGVLKAYDSKNNSEFLLASQDLDQLLRQVGSGPGAGAAQPVNFSRLKLEIGFNALDPFLWVWVIHLTAAVLVGLSFLFKDANTWFYRVGFGAFAAGVALSLYGFVLRCLIAGRPPVSNMYESLIWVTFGMTVFALVFELIFKTRFFVLAAAILGWLGFVLADNVPTILDPAIQPIEPVLRSNFWLTIHVLTITLSYAAFFLALGIGHVCLWSLWKYRQDKGRIQGQTRLLYRVVQVGVVLLAAGTILGGVWANYSWGRFWGWDPKETWALIALLGYVAILHGRLAGWLRELGFTIGVVAAFLGVLMAWYGVNFILGVGLHSYGFSKGGLPYVIGFVVLETILLTMVGLKAKTKPV